MTPLHPDHLGDLRRSGLADEIIQVAGLDTVPPDEIRKKLGGLANGVVSALAFPYPGFDGYERFKVWQEEGKTGPKYIQKTGTPNHLYFSPGVDLQGDCPLLVGEGEKKALALRQADYQVVGISGVYGWLIKGDDGSHPLPDFALVNWERPVTIIFDSDGHDNPLVRLAAFRLARELSRRGAAVSILFLPAGENGEKVGADDFLVAHGVEALGELIKTAWPFDPALNDHEAEVWWQVRDLTPDTPKPDTFKRLAALTPTLARLSNMEVTAILEELRARLKLRGEDLASLKADVKKARKGREAKGKKGHGKSQEISDLQEGLRLHPAIDFMADAMTIGFRVSLADNEPGLLLVFSDGQGVRADVNPETIESGERVYQVIQNSALPYLHFHGPKESGKSKSFEALRYTSFNAWKGRDITAAALGDTMDGLRGTLLLDQVEKLNNGQETGNLISLLADSYKKSGGQRRVVVIVNGVRSVLEFSAYGPKAYASNQEPRP